ncbi:MAG: sugar ABC transporter ATP-binding protein [Pirellulales bacterium]
MVGVFTPRLEMRGVSKRFGATRALHRVDLQLRPGEVLALVGENGAGKSTLMKVLSGAIAPDEGQMWLDGELFRPRNPLDARQRGIAMIYQELSLAPHLSVMENILLGIEPTAGPLIRWSEMRRRAAAALREIGMGDLRPDMPVNRLSIAQQQIVEIARAVALESRVLVLDEPTSSLSRGDIDRLFALIRSLRQRGVGIVYISHFLEEVQEISDRYAVLRDGELVGEGPTAGTPVEKIVALMVGREVEELYPHSTRGDAGEVVVEIRDLTCADKPRSASLRLRRGRVLGIAGLMGAGRTELMRAIFGLQPVTSGEIRVGGYTGTRSPMSRWAQGVGMVSEDRKQEGLAIGLTVADNITLPRLDGLGPARFVLPSRERAAAAKWVNRFSIKCASPAQRVAALSGGNQQKVAIARLLHADVDVLLLDEPTRGIDVGSKAQIYRLIDELAAGDPAAGRPAKAVLVISSYLPELLGVCDEIAVMAKGRLGPARPVAQWNEHQLMLAAIGKE